MKQYEIKIICAEDFADKGVEVLEHITEMLDKIYGDAEWCGFGGYVDDEEVKDENKQIRNSGETV